MTGVSAGSAGHRIFSMTLASVYLLYLAKVEKKGRTRVELDAVIGTTEQLTYQGWAEGWLNAPSLRAS